MTNYTDLIGELTYFAELDKDFIEPEDSINTKASEALRALIAERDAALRDVQKLQLLKEEYGPAMMEAHKRAWLEADRAQQITKLTAERDAALEDAAIAKANGEHWSLAYSKWVKTDLSAKKLIEQDAEIVALKSALKGSLDMLNWYYDQYADSEASKVINKINEVIGS